MKELLAALTVAATLLFGFAAQGGQVKFSWTPPSTYTDGTPLPPVSGYKLHLGTTSCNYQQHIDVGTFTNYSSTSIPDGTYYFAVTAYDASGVESPYSNEVSKTIVTPNYLITATSGPGGAITAADNSNVTIETSGDTTISKVTVQEGASQTLLINGNLGYIVSALTIDGVSVAPVASYTFSNINGDHTLGATFTAHNFTITASAGTGGTITPAGATEVPAGGAQSFTIAAADGYLIDDVKVDGVSVGAVHSYSFSNVGSDHSIQASFAQASHTITASAASGGSITPSGATTVPAGGTQAYTISAAAGYSIADVKVDGVSVGAVSTYTFSNVTADHSIEASFSAVSFSITATAGTGGSITPAGATAVGSEGTLIYTISPNAGYSIADVKVDGVTVGAVPTYTFSDVRTDHTIEASFSRITYTITASAGTGGSITPAGATTVPSGENQGYAIAAATGYSIADVTVDGASVGAVASYSFDNVSANHTIEASFAPLTFTITASAGTGGSISPSGSATVTWGGELTYSITAAAGYNIANVKVDGTSVGAVATYTFSDVRANHTIEASFSQITFTVTASAGTGGSITPAGASTVPYGGTLSYSIGAAAGYSIDDVKVDDVSVGARSSYTFSNVTANHTIAASFSTATYTITASAGAGGSIAPSGASSVAYGGTLSYSITPSVGYAITDLKVDGTSVGAVSTYTFSNVSASHTIQASFALLTYTISASAGSGGSIAPSGSTTVSYGGSQTYSITPSAGYRIADVRVDDVSVGPVSSYPFSNVTASHTIQASFAVITYTITSSAGTGGTITPSGSTTVASGGSQTYTIAAASGYAIADVKVDGVSVGALSSYTFSNVTANHTIQAAFSTSFAVNSGGSHYTTPSGVSYLSDVYFSGGSVLTTTAAIKGTTDVTLYRSARNGSSFSYAIPLPNGSYNVTLKFAEIQYSAAKKRVFNVTIGGATVISNLDIFARAGKNTAYDVTVPATVNNGVLNIGFAGVKANALVCAIRAVATTIARLDLHEGARVVADLDASGFMIAAISDAAHAALFQSSMGWLSAAAGNGKTVAATVPYALPPDRSVTWSGNVGVTGDIPLRTTVCATLSPGPDDTAAIKAAIASCPPGQVVALTGGVFNVTSPIVIKSEITLRGAGMGITVLKGAVGATGAYLVGFDAGPFYGTSYTIASGMAKDSATITTSRNHNWQVGDLVQIDQLNDSKGDPVVTNVGSSGTCTWCGRSSGGRSLGQLTRVSSVLSNDTVTLEIPLYWNYASALTPQGTRIEGGTVNAGIEDLTVDNSASGSINQSNDGGTIGMYSTSNCWLLRVEAVGSYRTMVRVKRGYRNTIRSCSFHEGVPPLPANGAPYDVSRSYGVWIGPGSANLVENNKLYHLTMPIKFDSPSSGNVIAYNYITDLYYINSNWNVGAINFHGGHPMMNLIEGNYSEGRLAGDDTWGSSSHNTFFRNRHGVVAGRTGAPWDFDLQKNATYFNVIGNVLGSTGLESVYSFNDVTLTAAAAIYRLGYTHDGDGNAAGNDPQVEATLLRQGNWDSVNQGVVWNGMEPQPLPPSMYLTDQPGWWGSRPWPAVGPDLSPMYPAAPGACNAMPWDDASMPSSSVPSAPTGLVVQ